MGLRLFFLPNFPGAMFIQGGTFIPDSRVVELVDVKGIDVAQPTLESGINVPPWINVAPGKFGKKNKRSPIYTLYLYY